MTVNEISPNHRAANHPIRRWLMLALIAWILLKCVGRVMMVAGPWGPRVGGVLPNHHEIYFQARPVGGETDDRLIWISPSEQTQYFWVDQIHAGFSYVTLKYTDNGNRVWVVSDGRVGASLDLVTADFRDESQHQHTWAVMNDGTTLAAGFTGSILWLLCPW